MRSDREIDTEYDLTAMIARPLYFGMMFNIVIPAALLFGCYYLSNKTSMSNHIPGIANELFKRSKPIFLLIAAIAFWGYVYFLLTGRFTESVMFVVFSFLVFQVVRPRYGSVRKLIRYQQALVDRGRLMGGGLAALRREVEGE